MKKKLNLIIAALMLLLLLSGFAQAGADREPVTVAIATDLHYLSPQLTDGGELFQNFVSTGDGKMTHYAGEITDAFFAQIQRTRPDYLVLSGDLTLNGAKASHEELAAKLGKLQQSGVQVLVIPGNHDVDKEFAVNYRDEGASKVEAMTSAEFMALYDSFGVDAASSHDGVTFSYSVDTGKGLRIVLLDTNCYGAGTIKEPTASWLEEELKSAQQAGDKVITVSHQNLYAHNRLLSFGYKLYNSAVLEETLEKYGVLCHFSGHIHSQSVLENTVPEIVTSSLTVSPIQYGVIDYANGQLNYETEVVDVSGWAKEQGSDDENLLDFSFYARQFFTDNCRRQVREMFADSELEEEEITLMQECFAQLNHDYFAGSKPDYEALKPGLEKWSQQEKSFTTMYIETMSAIDKDNRSYSVGLRK